MLGTPGRRAVDSAFFWAAPFLVIHRAMDWAGRGLKDHLRDTFHQVRLLWRQAVLPALSSQPHPFTPRDSPLGEEIFQDDNFNGILCQISPTEAPEPASASTRHKTQHTGMPGMCRAAESGSVIPVGPFQPGIFRGSGVLPPLLQVPPGNSASGCSQGGSCFPNSAEHSPCSRSTERLRSTLCCFALHLARIHLEREMFDCKPI